MALAKLPISFRGDALMNATYIINRVPSKFIPYTLYELWKGERPDLNIMQPWDAWLMSIIFLMNMESFILGGRSVSS